MNLHTNSEQRTVAKM